MKGVLLLSGGIDSPVAGYLMKSLGMELSCLSFAHQDQNDKVRKLAAKLGIKVEIRNFRSFQETVMNKANRRFQCILCKRYMYRQAEAYAKGIGAEYIITGESLGQVASQTLENMAVLDESVEMAVLRPLLGYDKDETIRIAKSIGTFDLSITENYDCPYAPRSPATRADIRKIKEEEWNIQESMQDTQC